MMSPEQARALAAAVTGDQYGWLTARLAAPAPVLCPGCGAAEYPEPGAIVLGCPSCYGQAARDA